ncbi:MAG: ATP-binding protein [Burkholderiales bacterium]
MTIANQAPNSERREFPARISALLETAAFAQGFCERHRVAQPVALRLTLVIEELFTNTVNHGHGGDNDATIVIGLSVAAARVRLSYADAAPRFDPRPWLRTPPESLSAPSAARPAGGLGLHLVGTFASGVRYAYRGGNRITLTIPIEDGDA